MFSNALNFFFLISVLQHQGSCQGHPSAHHLPQRDLERGVHVQREEPAPEHVGTEARVSPLQAKTRGRDEA